jgi:hypothetical protein
MCGTILVCTETLSLVNGITGLLCKPGSFEPSTPKLKRKTATEELINIVIFFINYSILLNYKNTLG